MRHELREFCLFIEKGVHQIENGTFEGNDTLFPVSSAQKVHTIGSNELFRVATFAAIVSPTSSSIATVSR